MQFPLALRISLHLLLFVCEWMEQKFPPSAAIDIVDIRRSFTHAQELTSSLPFFSLWIDRGAWN